MTIPNDRTAAIEVRGLSKQFRGFLAVAGVDLKVAKGDIHALVGPNGAGKTTLFNLLSGFVTPSQGTILLAGRDVTGMPPDHMARLGLARSFQITSLFAQMSILQHVELALQACTNVGYRFWSSHRRLLQFRRRAGELLDEVGLAHLAQLPAGSLAYGQKRALELAMALALDPSVLLLDEPTAGMGMEDVERTVALIRRVRSGRTIILVEHNMSVVGNLADRVTVLQGGRVLVDGTYMEVRRDPRVITAYLGASNA